MPKSSGSTKKNNKKKQQQQGSRSGRKGGTLARGAKPLSSKTAKKFPKKKKTNTTASPSPRPQRPRATSIPLDSYQLWLSRQKPTVAGLVEVKPVGSLLLLDSREQWLRKQRSSDAASKGPDQRDERQRKAGPAVRSTFEEWISGQVVLLRDKGGEVREVAEEKEEEVVMVEEDEATGTVAEQPAEESADAL